MRTFLRGKVTLLFIVVAALIAIPAIALADNVVNNVTTGGNDTITAGGSTTIAYRINMAAAGDPQSGCNASDGSAATVNLSVPAGVTASTNSLTFTACNTPQNVTFSSNTAGDYPINVSSISDSGTGNYNNQANFTLHVNPATPTDNTGPVITPTIVGTLGNNGWYTSNVDLSWSVTDPESDVTSTNGCSPTSITADQNATTYTCSATSAGGNSSGSVTIKRDATDPTLNPSVSPNPVLLNGSATATANANDATNPGSGLASSSCDTVDTSSVGSHSVSCTATDNAGNTNSASANYSVKYNFIGFSSPVDNPNVLNVAKAGSAIPLKWQLLDANGPVTNLSSVNLSTASLTCSQTGNPDDIEVYAAGSSGLQNLGGGYYQFNWKTPTNYANSCKTLTLNLGEGTDANGDPITHKALFQFKK